MDDASLDDFLGDDEAGDDETDTVTGDEAEVAATDTNEGAVEPARPTMAFNSDGGTCATCGERVVRRWIDDGNLVCADCKEW